jgi:hypothetical protein
LHKNMFPRRCVVVFEGSRVHQVGGCIYLGRKRECNEGVRALRAAGGRSQLAASRDPFLPHTPGREKREKREKRVHADWVRKSLICSLDNQPCVRANESNLFFDAVGARTGEIKWLCCYMGGEEEGRISRNRAERRTSDNTLMQTADCDTLSCNCI